MELGLPSGNALNLDSVAAMNATLDEIEASDARAVVLTGTGRVFCVGLDLVTAYEYDRATTERFVDAFDDLFLRVFSFPRPGGGGDQRARHRRGLHPGARGGRAHHGERALPDRHERGGARHPLPRRGPWRSRATDSRRGCGARPSWRASASPPRRRARRTWCTSWPTPRRSRNGRSDRARALGTAPSGAVAAVKADLLAPTLERVERQRVASRARFVDHWFSEAARAEIGTLRDQLLARR